MSDSSPGVIAGRIHTEAWREQHNIQVGQELLLIGIEMTQSSNNVPG